MYTGQGKGKTTAALGLALRAAGHGARVLIYQFLKPAELPVGERSLLQTETIDGITLRSLDEPWDMFESMGDQQALNRVRKAIDEALKELQTAAHEKYFDVIVLDEIVFCLSQGLARIDDIRTLIVNRDSHVELVLTGRGATEELIDMADLVTEMRPLKHPFGDGTPGRKGIEY